MEKKSENKLYFVERQRMTSVYEISDISDLPQMAYEHFMNYENEVIYLLRHGRIEGVYSIGDLERYYLGSKQNVEINKDYTYANTLDYQKALDFFEKAETVCEMPVVSENCELLGVIKRDKDRQRRKQQRQSLRGARYHEKEWYENELTRLVNNTRAKVFLYYEEPRAIKLHLGEDGRKILKRRRQMADEKHWKGLSNKEWRQFCGEAEYYPEIADDMKAGLGSCIPSERKGVVIYNDLTSRFFNCRNDHRITPNNPHDADRKIILYGACAVAGGYCRDDQTIAAYLQSFLSDNGYTSWEVVNKGICRPEKFYSRVFTEELSENDIVVIWIPQRWLPSYDIDQCVNIGNLTSVFLEMDSLIDNILDSYNHCNYKVNQKLAERIYKDIYASKLLDSPMHDSMRVKQQDYYIDWEIYLYFREYFEWNGLKKEDDVKIGAFVMMSNPFTQMHRIWVEEALKQVERLYIFIVEDPNMKNCFDDRLKMTKSGVEGLSGVTVIPAGKYIFPNKLSRSIRKGRIDFEAMEYDCNVWGEVVARQLGIRCRFLACEDAGPAMKEYHEKVKQILPQFDIEVVEFPREMTGRNY